MPGREPLPDGSALDDVVAAIQAAWLAENYQFVRDLIDRYLDSPPHQYCFRCAQAYKATGLYQFRPSDGPIVRLCDDCWHSIDKPRRDGWGPGITVGALLRDSFYDDAELNRWTQPDASSDNEP